MTVCYCHFSLNIIFVRGKFLQEILINYECSVGRYLQIRKWFSKILIGPIDSKKDIDPCILTYDFSLISLFHGQMYKEISFSRTSLFILL